MGGGDSRSLSVLPSRGGSASSPQTGIPPSRFADIVPNVYARRSLGAGETAGPAAGSSPCGRPDAPERGGICEGIPVDEEEVGRPSLSNHTSVLFAEQLVAAVSASYGSSPASTSDSTSHAMWFALVDPPPKSVPAAIRTPAAYAMRTLSAAVSRRHGAESRVSLRSSKGFGRRHS